MPLNTSTGAPTKEEQRRFVAIKEDGCLLCRIDGNGFMPCDIHHTLSGGIRRGHRYTFGACLWHHRGEGKNLWVVIFANDAAKKLGINVSNPVGPSLAKGSKLFHDYYGSDDELIAKQDERLKVAKLTEKFRRTKRNRPYKRSAKIVARRT